MGLTPDKRPSPNHQSSVSNDPAAGKGTPPASLTTHAVITTPEGPSVTAATTEPVARRIATVPVTDEEAGESIILQPGNNQEGLRTPHQQLVDSEAPADKRSAMKVCATTAVPCAPSAAGVAALATAGDQPGVNGITAGNAQLPGLAAILPGHPAPSQTHLKPPGHLQSINDKMAFIDSDCSVGASDASRLVLQTQLVGIWKSRFHEAETSEDGRQGGQRAASECSRPPSAHVDGNGDATTETNERRRSLAVETTREGRRAGEIAKPMGPSSVSEPLSAAEERCGREDEWKGLSCSALQLPGDSASVDSLSQLMMVCSRSIGTLLAQLPLAMEQHPNKSHARGRHDSNFMCTNASAGVTSVWGTRERGWPMLGSTVQGTEVEMQQHLVNLWGALHKVSPALGR